MVLLPLKRTAIFGNSGSGKSTLARYVSETFHATHLDLDSVAWAKADPIKRRSLEESAKAIHTFTQAHRHWVVEGCYTSLIKLICDETDELVFLNPGVSACQANCRNRPWEPHKYASKADQDKNLPMLLDWVAAYESRDDEFSLSAHRHLFKNFTGAKI